MLLHFTQPNGHDIELRADQITGVRDPLPHEMASGTRSVLELGANIQAVRETRAEVDAKLS